jgi:hypothetical protein
MKTWLLCAIFLLTALSNDGEEPLDRQANAAKVRAGMSIEEVQTLLGPPNRIARQILYRRCAEQWIYDTPEGLWINWDCLKGQEPRVLSVHAARAAFRQAHP